MSQRSVSNATLDRVFANYIKFHATPHYASYILKVSTPLISCGFILSVPLISQKEWCVRISFIHSFIQYEQLVQQPHMAHLSSFLFPSITTHIQNAFLHPSDPDSIFPQKQLVTPIDFRSEALPLSGYCVPGLRRKFTPEEKEEMNRCCTADAVRQSSEVTSTDANDLIFEVEGLSLEDVMLNRGTDLLKDLKIHQERVGGRAKKAVEVPKVKNKLRKGGRRKY